MERIAQEDRRLCAALRGAVEVHELDLEADGRLRGQLVGILLRHRVQGRPVRLGLVIGGDVDDRRPGLGEVRRHEVMHRVRQGRGLVAGLLVEPVDHHVGIGALEVLRPGELQ